MSLIEEREDGSVSFTLDGDSQVYVLKFDFNTICDVEADLKCNLMEGIMGGEFNAGSTRALLYALLKASHPLVLLPEAGGLLSKEMATVIKALTLVLKGPRGIKSEEPAVVPETLEPEPAAA